MTPGPVARCWGCDKPLTAGPFNNPHRLYHDHECRRLHQRRLAEFKENNPELPGRGGSPVASPSEGDILRIVYLSDGGLGVRFAKGPTSRAVRRHYGTSELPLTYYLDPKAEEADAVAFLHSFYPRAEVA